MANPRSIWKFSILTFVILHCITGLTEGVLICYVLLRRFSIRYFLESHRLSILVSFVAPSVVFLTAVVGWRSVSKIQPRLIKTFSVLLSLAVLLEIAVSIWCFSAQQEFPRLLSLSLNDQFQQQFVADTTAWWDILQTQFNCCGINGPADYVSLHKKVPASCFTGNVSSTLGCFSALKDAASQDFGVVALAFIIIACLQIPGVFLSWCFSNRINSSQI